MRTETLMWLLPTVFMIHEFEEVIMLMPCLSRDGEDVTRKFPGFAARVLPAYRQLSTSSFAFAILEEFAALSVVTYICVEFDLYDVWTGVLTAFSIHLIVHIIQFAVYRRYLPFVVTSVLCLPYCVYAPYFLFDHKLLALSQAALWTMIAAAIVYPNIALALRLAIAFEKWLDKSFKER